MSKLARILVPIDFTPRSAAALDYAIDMGRRLDSRIHLLHAYAGSGCASADRDRRIVAQLRLAGWAEKVNDGGIAVQVSLSPRPVWDAIADALERWGADLLVLGSRRGPGERGALRGTAAETALRRSRCAVLTVKLASHRSDFEGEFRPTRAITG